MEKQIKIKVLQIGLLNAPEKSPKIYTENEFINKFGVEIYDAIIDLYFEFHDDEKDKNGHVRIWEFGLNVEIWDE